MQIKTLTVLRTISGNEPFSVSIQSHSPDGNVINTIDYDIDHFAAHSRHIEYDAKGRLAVQNDKYPREQIETLVKFEYQGRQWIERSFYQDGGNSKTVVTSNDQNKVLSVEKFDDETSEDPYETEKFEYDAAGNWLLRSITDSDQNRIEAETRKYNEEGLVIESEFISGENKGRKLTSQYDEKKRLTRRDTELNGKNIQEIAIVYGEDGSRDETIENEYINPKYFHQQFDRDNRVIFQEMQNFSHGRNQTIKVRKEYNDMGLIMKDTSEDDLDTLNNYTDNYQYEFYPEAASV